jgi:hypothetical protein
LHEGILFFKKVIKVKVGSCSTLLHRSCLHLDMSGAVMVGLTTGAGNWENSGSSATSSSASLDESRCSLDFGFLSGSIKLNRVVG